jgi:hypothetical protein
VRRQLVAKALLSQNDVTFSLEHYEPEHTARQLLIDRGLQRSTKGGGILSESHLTLFAAALMVCMQ